MTPSVPPVCFTFDALPAHSEQAVPQRGRSCGQAHPTFGQVAVLSPHPLVSTSLFTIMVSVLVFREDFGGAKRTYGFLLYLWQGFTNVTREIVKEDLVFTRLFVKPPQVTRLLEVFVRYF